MNNYLSTLKKSSLFSGLTETEIGQVLGCLSARQGLYEKGETIFRAGVPISELGMVLSGKVHLEREDFWGNRDLLSVAETGQIFGGVYACTRRHPLGVRAVAAEKTELLFLNVQRAATSCASACRFHTKLIQNLLQALAEKTYLLERKLEHIAKRTTQDKLLSYLSEQAELAGGRSFIIPLNRQELADYLSLNRSAMSGELCKMRDAGILSFQKNQFTLLD